MVIFEIKWERTSQMCESCGGEDYNEHIMISVENKAKVPRVRSTFHLHLCKSCTETLKAGL